MRWLHDFGLGVRLAVGGGRTSWSRVVLGTIGIGLATTVLLLFASVGHMLGNANARIAARTPSTVPIAGKHPTQLFYDDMSFHGVSINGNYLHGTAPDSPVPPGLSTLPGPNEVAVSPALADLLRTQPNLRPRFPQKIVGTIGDAGLRGPAELMFYAGTDPLPDTGPGLSAPQRVYAFGAPSGSRLDDPTLLVVAILGGVAVLIPILIFVSVSSRIAGAQRDRRLAALRLVGSSDRQVRRVAAAESLVGAAAGLAVGALAFLGLRQLAPQFDLLGWSTFVTDVVPSASLVVVIVLLVPALAVGTVLFALRRVIIEPLGVVRESRPIRRQLWWRLGLIVVGIGLLLVAKPFAQQFSDAWITLIVVGASSLLIGVPAILPWLIERVVDRVHGGAPSWQLAIRRLQLDSGTPARVVSGIAVVLASAVSLQLMLLATSGQNYQPPANGWVTVDTTPAAADRVAADLAKVPAAKQVGMVQLVSALDADGDRHTIAVASCTAIEGILDVHGCRDGDGYVGTYAKGSNYAKAGQVWSLVNAHGPSTPVATYRVPGDLTPATQRISPLGDVVLTPAAAASLTLPTDRDVQAWVLTDPTQAGATDQIATGLGDLTWQVFIGLSGADQLSGNQQAYATIRNALLTASLFTLLLAGVSMLVLALEQIRERRRPLAMLAAAGVPRSTLARSLLWQTAVPVALAVVVAVGIGIGIAGLVIRMVDLPLRVDWPTIGVFAAAAVALVFAVTALTLPALRGATRLAAMRTE
ncbi:FtsX-like permease family protein [Kutzneria buriramensis]|uniref:FtsX-like permease family protein n=1 Tax=Kutzneria buriramensis TaxID=1045776 RepID=A0A3E0H710_9PSEU|nr:FtsX-like permease family protein [Kutzneria buriramensis]REH39233.1 FtsX-like permease family protein [Kutzneria buriramensis]